MTKILPLKISNRMLCVCVFLILPLLTLLTIGRFELRPDHYNAAGVSFMMVNYALFCGVAYVVARAAGAAIRARLLTALMVGALFCAAFLYSPITF